MAQHNPQSRTYLVVVLVATVVCFVIAQMILGGGHGDSHSAAEHDGGHKTEASDASHTETMPADAAAHGGEQPHQGEQAGDHE